MQNKLRKGGLLIAFEGIDGAGKTTQIKLLAKELIDRGFRIVVTHEPTNGEFGRKIRQLFTNRKAVSQEEELGYFIEDRREHVKEVIRPAIAEGKIVLTDRYYFSNAAYQGADGHDWEMIIRRNETFAPIPDLVILLVTPPSEGIHRICTFRQETLNDFEKESYLNKVSANFDQFNRDFIKRCDGTQSMEVVHHAVMFYVNQLVGYPVKTGNLPQRPQR